MNFYHSQKLKAILAEAHDSLDRAIRVVMDRDQIDYNAAVRVLALEMPQIFEGVRRINYEVNRYDSSE